MINFPTLISDFDNHRPPLLDLFISPIICSTVFPRWEILIVLFSQLSLTFLQIQKVMPLFITQLTTILVLIGRVFVTISEMSHARIFLNSLILLLLLLNFEKRVQSELMCISLIVNIRSSS